MCDLEIQVKGMWLRLQASVAGVQDKQTAPSRFSAGHIVIIAPTGVVLSVWGCHSPHVWLLFLVNCCYFGFIVTL